MYRYDAFEFVMELLVGAVSGTAVIWRIARYAIRAVSLYTIARRRGLSKPWLAWIPVARNWMLGSVSDQYQYLTRGKVRTRRHKMLVLSILWGVCRLALLVAGLTLLALEQGFWFTSTNPSIFLHHILQRVVVVLQNLLPLMLVALVIDVVKAVFRWMSTYDLYKSCEPKNATVYLVLSILFGVTEPFFLLACKNKDDGMPPRRPDYKNEYL